MVEVKKPQWVYQFLKASDFNLIEESVKKVELKTSGEVVPMIVRSSIYTGHVSWVLGLLYVILFLIFDAFERQREILDLLSHPLMSFDILIIPFNIILGYLIVLLLCRFQWIKRLLTAKVDMLSQVHQRALLEFYNQRVHKTQKSTGILIFISLLERQAVVLVDKAISDKIAPTDWQAIVDILIKGIKSKEVGVGFCEAIEKSGHLLETHFPITKNDQNELPNQLIIKE